MTYTEEVFLEQIHHGDIVKVLGKDWLNGDWVKVFSKGPWLGIRPGTGGVEGSLWGIWAKSPEELEERWRKAADEKKLKPASEDGVLQYNIVRESDSLRALCNGVRESRRDDDRVILVLEDL
jgi:hypothetical protein